VSLLKKFFLQYNGEEKSSKKEKEIIFLSAPSPLSGGGFVFRGFQDKIHLCL